MDASWQPMQGSNPAAGGGDWRAELQPDARSRVVAKILEILKKHLPVPSAEALNELQRIAARFEENVYAAATGQSDYLRKISLKMLSMETEAQQAPGNAQLILNQNNPGQVIEPGVVIRRVSADSTAQTGRASDWQEEIYQMIKSLKDQHFVELNELFNKISLKLQHVDSIVPRQMTSEQYEKMKIFKTMVDRLLQVLQISKSTIEPSMRNKVPQYEKQIISILVSQRRKPVQRQVQQQFQPPAGQAPSSSISQQKQPSQSLQQHDSHANPQARFSSMGTGLQSSSAAVSRHVPEPPTTNFRVYTQQNGADIQRQAVSDLEAAQGINFNSLQYVSMGGALRQGSTMNAQLQTGSSSSSMLSHLSGQRKQAPKRSWSDTY